MKKNLCDKYKTLPATTAAQHRLQIFQANRRPRRIEKIIQTNWGKVRIEGKLGQAHADVIEAIFNAAENKKPIEDGRIKILVDPAEIARITNQNSVHLKRILNDIMTTLIEIQEPKELACMGHIIDYVDLAYRLDGSVYTKKNPFGGDRPMWKVEIGKAACKLLDKDLPIWREKKQISDIAGLQYGISQAITRHILTHKNKPKNGWIMDNLIKIVSGEINNIEIKHRRQELREDKEKLEFIGIEIIDNRIFYRKPA